mgnify:CR=1 FL=1
MHHYAATEYSSQPSDINQARDNLKLQLAAQKGVTLITVPCWWDGKQGRWGIRILLISTLGVTYLLTFLFNNSLVASIKKKRPDLLGHVEVDSIGIPNAMPPRFLEKNSSVVEGIGVPIAATFFTKADADPTNW